jgi:hypothetical protein
VPWLRCQNETLHKFAVHYQYSCSTVEAVLVLVLVLVPVLPVELSIIAFSSITDTTVTVTVPEQELYRQLWSSGLSGAPQYHYEYDLKPKVSI